MLKEEHRIRAMAKLGRHMKKDVDYVKTAIYQSCVDIAFSKNSIDLIVEEVYGTPQDIIEDEIMSALGHLLDVDLDNDKILEALTELGQKPTLAN
jgi:hypothetical protein